MTDSPTDLLQVALTHLEQATLLIRQAQAATSNAGACEPAGIPGEYADDHQARKALVELLRTIRLNRGVTQKVLAERLAVDHSQIGNLENGTNWRVATLQRWCRGLGMRLQLTLRGLPEPVEADELEAVYARMHPTTPADIDHLALLRLLNYLTRVRRHLGLSGEALARRMGLSKRAPATWEARGENSHLNTMQRYARGLGGWLEVLVVPDDTPGVYAEMLQPEGGV